MKSAVFAASVFASMAMATPVIDKRYEVTSYVATVTEFTTVTGVRGQQTQAAVAAAADGGRWGNWGNWGNRGGQSSEAAPTPTSQAIPVETQAASSTWSQWTQPAASSSPAAQPSSPPSQDGLSAYAAPIMKQHNLHRANHSAPAAEWDDNLASIAATIASSCVYAHDTSAGGGGYGQNIGAGSKDTEVDQMITNAMYNDEIGYYPGYGGEPDMGNFENWGHFSQIVWKSTTKIGCATQYCPGGLANVGGGVSPYFTVCNYSPPGNFGGQYGANVLAPQGAAVDVVG